MQHNAANVEWILPALISRLLLTRFLYQTPHGPDERRQFSSLCNGICGIAFMLVCVGIAYWCARKFTGLR